MPHIGLQLTCYTKLPQVIETKGGRGFGEGQAAHNRHGLFFIVEPNREQLGEIAALIDSAAIRPVIAETIPLARAREAFERGVAGHTRGKLVLQVAAPERASA